MSVRVLVGDARAVLRALPMQSVHCVVTSPPYWGLRDYGVAGQMGLEPTLAEFVVGMVDVFAEVHRVLRDDGTCWVNLGDSYAQAGGPGWQGKNGQRADRRFTATRDQVAMREITRKPPSGLKPKDLCGVPWRVALALQDAGWYLRQDIIWHKPNPMPESIRDRCTKAHEYLFLLAKSERYYFDADAIREDRASVGGGWVNGLASGDTPHLAMAHARDKGNAASFRGGGKYTNGQEKTPESVARESRGNVPAKSATRNKRSVWTIAPEPFKGAHFATFPTRLVEPCILAGCPRGGVVLDPFGGAGTVGVVADRLGRDGILIELNPAYADMARARIEAPQRAKRHATANAAPCPQHSLFAGLA